MKSIPYDRKILVDVLVHHYRKDISSCGCGWAELGRSHSEHVATVYEESVRVRPDGNIIDGQCQVRKYSLNGMQRCLFAEHHSDPCCWGPYE